MDELVKMISQKLNLSEEDAQQAVDMVINFVKEKLPSSISGHLETLLGSDDLLEQAGDLGQSLEGLLGGLGKK
ncbi:MAG: hypothetical protein JXA37_14400 [Chloroflexia bacterium]|nr:hypothetical protein [Chloroflexia bacterium]